MTYQQRRAEQIKALIIQRSLGTKSAAAYLRNRGHSLECALSVLCAGE